MVTRAFWIFALLISLFLLERVEAGVLQVPRLPSRQIVIVPSAPGPSSNDVAKLPPPSAPGMDTNTMPSSIRPRNVPVGIEIEDSKPSASSVSTNNSKAIDLAKKARIDAERERLTRNTFIWEQDRAAHGSPVAMRSIGFRYLKGNGVPKDEVKAREWLEKAAELGEVTAKKELEKLDASKQSAPNK